MAKRKRKSLSVESANREIFKSIYCPIDLDALILSESCTIETLEENLSVGDIILYDAISNSMCSPWLLSIDVFKKMSNTLRNSILSSFGAFPAMAKRYFIFKLSEMGMNSTLEYVLSQTHDSLYSLNLNHPYHMLGNDVKKWDNAILDGTMTLQEVLHSSIVEFLNTKDRYSVDFSHSLFLPELLNPKFFMGFQEAEQLVILGNMDKYFAFVRQFNRSSIFSSSGNLSAKSKELNQPQCLIKHILSGEYDYGDTVRNLAWGKIFDEIQNTSTKVIDVNSIFGFNKKIVDSELLPNGLSEDDISSWADNANGVFESFELDCTLHNLNSVKFVMMLLTNNGWRKMIPALLDFQDQETRNKIYKDFSKVIMEFR